MNLVCYFLTLFPPRRREHLALLGYDLGAELRAENMAVSVMTGRPAEGAAKRARAELPNVKTEKGVKVYLPLSHCIMRCLYN